MAFEWTERRVDALKAMWASGKSGSEIAEAFGYGVSRGAICGKVRRLNLPLRGKSLAALSMMPQSPSAGSLSAPKKRNATLPKSVKVATATPKEAAKAAASASAITQAEGACLVPFLDIGPGECQFVVEERPAIMCGAPVHIPGEAWCRYHRALVYVPVPKRKAEIRRMNSVAVAASKGGKTVLPIGW